MSAGSKSGLRYSSHPGLVRASPGPPSQSFSRPSNETHRASPAGPALAFGGEEAQQRGRVRHSSRYRRTAAHQGKIRRRQRAQPIQGRWRGRAEKALEGQSRLRLGHPIEPQLDQKPAQTGAIQPGGQIGGAGERQRVLLHPGQHFVDLADR